MEHKLIAFYEQTLNASEQKEVEQWLETDPAHKKIYEDTVTIWESSKKQLPYTLYNKEKAWEKLQQQLNDAPSIPPQKKAGKVISGWWKLSVAAASVAAVLLLFIFINRPKTLQFTAQQEPLKFTLDDHSLITLFPGADLLVAADFNKNARTVTLKGNARFDIAKDPARPFVIHNNGMKVEVLGTSFTIQQRKDFQTVFVHSGKVKASIQGESVIAVARQKIVRNNKTNQLQLKNITTDIDDILKTQSIKVKDIRIDSLARLLEDLYNIKVEQAATVTGKKITSTYFIGSETPEQIIENIALTINASWTKKDNQYIITK